MAGIKGPETGIDTRCDCVLSNLEVTEHSLESSSDRLRAFMSASEPPREESKPGSGLTAIEITVNRVFNLSADIASLIDQLLRRLAS